MTSLIPFALVQFAAAILMLVLAWQAFSRHPQPGATWLGVSCGAVAIWALCDALTIASPGYGLKLFWNQVSYLGIATVPVAWFVFALDYAGGGRSFLRRHIAFMFVPSLITIVLAATNAYHGLIWSDITLRDSLGTTWLSFRYGLGFWISSVYSYLLLLVGSYILIEPMMRSFRLRRSQALWMFAGVLAPWVANVAYLAGWLPDVGTDLTSLAFSFSCLAVTIAVQRHGLFDIVPVARASIIEDMQDGLLVMDQAGRVLDANPAAQRFLGLPGDEILGRPLYHLFPDHLSALGEYLTDPESDDLYLHIGHAERSFELRLSTLPTHIARTSARLAMMHEITEREQLVSELQTALDQVRALGDLLPICAACKRVRNDEGYWSQLELYLAAHPRAELSQGLCPDCMAKFHDDWPGDHGQNQDTVARAVSD